MQTRILTEIAELRNVPNVRHYAGLPPELTEGEDIRKELPSAVLAIIEEAPDGIFLKRYDRQGRCVGDTWHMMLMTPRRKHYLNTRTQSWESRGQESRGQTGRFQSSRRQTAAPFLSPSFVVDWGYSRS